MSSKLYLTFDDRYIDLWHGYSQGLVELGVRSTFFVSEIEAIESSEIDKLLEMQEMGHEIGCHSLYHLHPHEFLEVLTIRDYMQYEVIPSLRQMKAYGFKVDSWAYPFNAYTPNLAKEIAKHFRVQRTRTDNFLLEPSSEIPNFESSFHLLKAISIDTFSQGREIKSDEDMMKIFASIKLAAQEGRSIVLYGHAIGKHENLSHSIDPDSLLNIINTAKLCNLNFATTREAIY
jgi:peptidoglycan/xylan/chitin deacetylase (PgdA/CDA1 family)